MPTPLVREEKEKHRWNRVDDRKRNDGVAESEKLGVFEKRDERAVVAEVSNQQREVQK